MNLVMTEYAPRAQCSGPGTFSPSGEKLAACAQIVEGMEISRSLTVFGPPDNPATQCITPYLILNRGAPRPLLVYEPAHKFTL